MTASLALFSAAYPPHLGGVENFTQGLARALVARGDRVVVVTNDTEGVGAGLSDEGGVEVLRLPCRPLLAGRLPLPRAGSERRRLLAGLCRRPLDGVLVNTRFYPHSLLGMRLARERGLTPAVLDHGSAWLTLGSPALDVAVRAWERAVTAWGRRYQARYYGISEKSAAWLSTFGIRAAGVIPNAIDAPAFRAAASGRDFRAELGVSADTLLVAFVGRLVVEKGVRQVLEASRDARLSGRDVAFVVVGDGPLAPEVERARSPRLRRVGALEAADVAALLLQADALLLPTRSEGFSTVLLEAAACGCPPVVTDVGGAREVVAGPEYGTILPSADVRAILDAVCELEGDRELVRLRSRMCRARVEERFSWDATAAALEDALLGG